MIDILFYFAALKHTFFLTPLIDNFDHLFQFFLFSISLYICVSLSSNHVQLKAEGEVKE